MTIVAWSASSSIHRERTPANSLGIDSLAGGGARHAILRPNFCEIGKISSFRQAIGE
jgi:hypothetical protein